MIRSTRNTEDDTMDSPKCAGNEIGSHEPALEIVRYALSILEKRRDTIVARANVLLTANAMLLAGMLALISSGAPWAQVTLTRVLLLVAVVCAGASIFFTLGMISVFAPTRGEKIPEDDLVHFRRLALLSGPEYVTMISRVNKQEALCLYAGQACGLSKFLVKRYGALDNGHKGFLLALTVFLIGLGWGIVTTLSG